MARKKEEVRFFSCTCFYFKNIFLRKLLTHIEFFTKEQFVRDYSQVLQSHGFSEEDKINELISEIEDEVDRRKNRVRESEIRKSILSSMYTPKHPQLYKLEKSFLSPAFLAIVDYCKLEDATFEGLFDFIQETNVGRTYSMPVFTEKFCHLFLDEMNNFELSDAPKGRPNTMNRYGVLLDELGFDPFFTSLREDYLNPIAELLFPDWGGGKLDSHKVFTVQYESSKDTDLSYHYDNAEVTLNVALSPQHSYKGGNLYFGSMRNEEDTVQVEYEHESTMGVIHRGQHRHGALPVTEGERCNLIIWMRSSIVRNVKCPMCDQVPQLQESEGFGDGFTRPTYVDVCSVI